MKKIVLALMLCIVSALMFVSCATAKVEDYSYSKVIEVPNYSASELFVKANIWMVDVFKNAGSVIEYTDKEAGIAKGKFVSFVPDLSYMQQLKFESIISVETKDEKVRLTITLGSVTHPAGSQIRSLEPSTLPKYYAIVESVGMSLEEALKSKESEW